MELDTLLRILALAAAGVALYTDLRWGKIYNWLTLPLLALGPTLHAVHGGWAGLGGSLAGAGMMVVLLLALCLLVGPGLGGGDLKLLVALGGLLGWPAALWLLLYTGASGLVVVVPVMLRRRNAGLALRNMALNLMRRRAGDRSVSVSSNSVGPKLPYGVCIALGTLVLLLRGPLG